MTFDAVKTVNASNSPQRFHIAVLALGGQGGGVLVDWIVDLAEHAGWTAQSTSVAGVAQRTGATIYYIELFEPTPGREPIMALMPVSGEVDILMAAEWMEAARAVERGLVSPDRTTVIASSHRTYAVSEKVVPGNGVSDAQVPLQWVQAKSRHLIAADLQALAVAHGSVMSSALFGALAGSGVLPFGLDAFEAVIRRSGLGVNASVSCLQAAAQAAQSAAQPEFAREPMATPPRALPTHAASPDLQPLVERIRRDFVPQVWPWLGEGVARLSDYQDVAYASEYLDLVERVQMLDHAAQGHALTLEAARWLAVAMSYDDVIRVADLKSRTERFARLREEIGAESSATVHGSEEFFHPRLDEVMGILPEAWAQWLHRQPRVKVWLAKGFQRGRRIHTHTLWGHVQLRAMAGLRRWRRSNHRHQQEVRHWQQWLQLACHCAPHNPALALEVLRCRRLIKGYSDTHSRGQGKYDLLMAQVPHLQHAPDGAQRLRSWLRLALEQVDVQALELAIRTDMKSPA